MSPFYEHLKDHKQDDLDYCLSNACIRGHLELVKYLLTTKELGLNADINSEKDAAFRIACQKGHLDIIKYLLTSPELVKHSNISAKDNEGLQWAACHGHFEVVKYLMTSRDLKEHAKIGNNYCNALTMTCSSGHINILDYFLNQEKIDIHIFNDSAFVSACNNKQYDLLEYLIFDYNISKTKFIVEHLQNKPDIQVEKMLTSRDSARDLSKELQNSLLLNKSKKSKIKL